MDKIALLFSGQGAQFAGMGKSLYEQFEVCEDILERAEGIFPGIKNLCFNGGEEELRQTKNTQPAVYCVSYMAAQALRSKGIFPEAAAGFSAGEIAAMAFAGVFSFEEGLRIIMERARLMQLAAEKNPGAMAAVLKLPCEEVEALCEQCGVYAVNYNSDLQTVAAGETDKIRAFSEEVKKKGGRAVPLAVGGAFHSPLMAQASDAFYEYIKDLRFSAPTLNIYSNKTARPYCETGEDIHRLLAQQICAPVLFKQTLGALFEKGTACFLETGPGNVLCGLVKKQCPEAAAANISEADSLSQAVLMVKDLR